MDKKVYLSELTDEQLESIKKQHEENIARIGENQYEKILREIERRKERVENVDLSPSELEKITEIRARNAGKITIEENKDEAEVLPKESAEAIAEFEEDVKVDEAKEIKESLVADLEKEVDKNKEEEKESFEAAVADLKEKLEAKEEVSQEDIFKEKINYIIHADEEPLRQDHPELNNEEWAKTYEAWRALHPKDDFDFSDYDIEDNLDSTAIYTKEIEQHNVEKKNKGWLWLIPLFLALLLLGLLLKNNLHKKAMEKSYEEVKSSLFVQATSLNEPLKLEVGEELTYSPSEIKGMESVPDQLRPLITSVPEDTEISVSPINNNLVGEQDLVITLTKVDKYGQKISNTQTIPFVIEDTIEPDVKLKASSISIASNEISKIKDNIEGIVDPVFGEYRYSDSKENGTYSIDTSRVNFEQEGRYPVELTIYDNGKEIKQQFDVVIDKVVKENQAQESNQSQSNQTNQAQSGSSSTQSKPEEKPEPYVFVDQYGNKYTQSQVDAMNNGSYQFVEEDESIYNSTGAKSPEEAACYASNGKWENNKCSWEDDSTEPSNAE